MQSTGGFCCHNTRPPPTASRRWRKLLYIRSHWLRMPPLLLAYHLGHKALFPPEVVSVPLADEKAR